MKVQMKIPILSTLMAGSCCAVSVQTTNWPNIIIIFTDDHGFTDLGIHGVDPNVQTPLLDALATGGALMKNGYSSAPQCVPSRAGLMSGRIQNTFGLRDNGDEYLPLNVPTLAERLKTLGGYKTGMVGKWHLNPLSTTPETNYPGDKADYNPGARGFDEYWFGSMSPYLANFNLAGNLVPEQNISDSRNRVIVQGEAAQAFIGRNKDQPFFLYLALYGPHWPRIEKTDPYYLTFPALDYPNYDSEMDDIRRLGLGLVKAIDDAVGGVMQKLRSLGLEENTLILFAGDNGAPPKFWNAVGDAVTKESWTGSENLPLRGEKGSLWEGGIKVPMFAYWKSRIPANQLIAEPVSTLDFTATILKLAGGAIPSEFDGVDILPRLTGQTNSIARPKPLFWDWGEEIAILKGDWKVHRKGNRKSLFNLAVDPYELYDLKYAQPAKFAELETELMAWYNALPPEGRSKLVEQGDDLYVLGAPAGVPPDPRFLIPYTSPAPAAYPAPLQIVGVEPSLDSDGDGTTDVNELAAGRNPYDASDLAFEFNTNGDLEGWVSAGFINSYAVTNGLLAGQVASNQGKFEFYAFNFAASQVDNLIVRLKSPVATGLTFRWGNTASNSFDASRTLTVSYASNAWKSVVIPMKGLAEWDGTTITRMRLNPANKLADFEVDWIRGSSGDLDRDLLPDLYEWQNGLDAASAADGNADGDSDGMTRGQEYIAGTDDRNPASKFSIQPVESNSAFRFRWDGKAGRVYSVWSTPQLVNPAWMPVTNFNVLSADQPVEFNEPPPAQQRFYKVNVQIP